MDHAIDDGYLDQDGLTGHISAPFPSQHYSMGARPRQRWSKPVAGHDIANDINNWTCNQDEK